MPDAATDIQFATAFSDVPQTAAAVADVVDQLIASELGAVDLLLVCMTAHHAAEADRVRTKLRNTLNPGTLLGTTAEGVITDRHEQEREPGLAVMAARLPGVTLRTFRYDQLDLGSATDAPADLAAQTGIIAAETAAILLLADPFSTPMVRLLPLMDEAWPGLPVIGGMASAARQPGQNRLLLDGEVLDGGAVGLAIGGAIRVDTLVSQGCRPIGKPMIITRSHRHIVQELGGRSALTMLQEMAVGLDEADKELIRTGSLQVGRVINEYRDRFGRGDFLIRAILGVDSDTGYIAIGDPQVRVGQTIQFHVRDEATAREDLQLLLDAQLLHDPPRGVLLCTCNGRGTRLYGRKHVDAEMIGDTLGNPPTLGFFAAGELGPIGPRNFLHGHTASLAVFRAKT